MGQGCRHPVAAAAAACGAAAAATAGKLASCADLIKPANFEASEPLCIRYRPFCRQSNTTTTNNRGAASAAV